MKENNKIKKYGAMLLYYAVWFVIGAVISLAIINNVDDTANVLIIPVLFYFAFILQLIIHEAGHLVFGLLSGYKFLSFRILSFAIIKGETGLRFKNYTVAGTGGQCLMLPPKENDEGKIPYKLYNLGGVIMNFAFAAIFFALYFVVKKPFNLSFFFLMLSLCGAANGIINGVPMSVGLIDNDGQNVISIGKNDEAMHAFIVQLKLSGAAANGVRMKDMPNDWFVIKASGSMKNAMVAQIAVLACNKLLDEHRFDDTKHTINRFLHDDTAIIPFHRNLLSADLLYCELVTERNTDIISEIMLDKSFDKFMKQMRNNPSVLRTQYAYELLCSKNIKKALKIKKRFERITKQYPFIGEIAGETELMEFAESICVSA